MDIYPLSVCTTNPNTPDSDLCARVLHTVHMSDGTTRSVMAEDPVDALNRVANALLQQRQKRLVVN